jgi:glycine dehydrogenase subunit 1
MTSYCPHTPDEIKQMLETIGVRKMEDLFSEIPEPCRPKGPIALPDGISESEIIEKVSDLADRNRSSDELICFLGGGAYDHFIPAAIKHLLLRGEFFTAYTPYQPEVSQGTLQAIFEFQSLICELTGMDVANASMYEGATALAEAGNMAVNHTGRKKLVVPMTVHPQYRDVIRRYSRNLDVLMVEIPFEDGVTDLNRLQEAMDDKTAAVFVSYPNFFGGLEDVELISQMAKKAGALTIVSAYPIALGMLTSPGCLGVDIVTGEGQSLGIPLGFGGPYLGFMAARNHVLRKLPGRISGKTVDKKGREGYVLTLQAREQHIRREKATSNICTNQALMALNATIFLSLLGDGGLREMASQSFQKAHYLKKEMERVADASFPFATPFFNEFVIRVPGAKKRLKALQKEGILGGILLEEFYPVLKDAILVAVTEKRNRHELDLLVHLLGGGK